MPIEHGLVCWDRPDRSDLVDATGLSGRDFVKAVTRPLDYGSAERFFMLGKSSGRSRHGKAMADILRGVNGLRTR